MYVWNDMKEHFAQGDLIRIFELMQDIYVLQQDSKFLSKKKQDSKSFVLCFNSGHQTSRKST